MIKSDRHKKSVVIFAKNPKPGNVKTRIGIFLGHDYSCQIYEAMLLDLIEKIRFQNSWSCHFYIYPPDEIKSFGDTYNLSPDCVFPQQGPDLGIRMYNSFVEQINLGADEIICIGSDIPAISLDHIDSAFSILSSSDSVFGPAADGGYYLIGFRKKAVSDFYFSEIKWSSCTVFSDTVDRIALMGFTHKSINTLRDLDDLSDLEFYKDLLIKNKSISPRLNNIINVEKNVGTQNG